MFKLLARRSDKPAPLPLDPLDIKRYTRVEPREGRVLNQQNYSRFAASTPKICEAPTDDVQIRRVPKTQASTPRSQATAKPETNLAAHLYSDSAISVALLRRSLPKRFGKIDARRQKAMMDSDTLDFALG